MLAGDGLTARQCFFSVVLIIKSVSQEGLDTNRHRCGSPIFTTGTRICCAARLRCYKFVDLILPSIFLALVAIDVSPTRDNFEPSLARYISPVW